MLSKTEFTFLYLFRKTVIATAGLALFVAACGIIYWAVAEYSPYPASYADRVSEFRERLSVSELVREHFPADSKLVIEAKTMFPSPKDFVIIPDWNDPFKENYQKSFNVYLSDLMGRSYVDVNGFEYAVNSKVNELDFNFRFHDPTASDERNFYVLIGSLLVEYVNELEKATPKLVEFKKSGDYVASFEKLEEDDYQMALSWFFSELSTALADVDQEILEREVFQSTSNVGLITAACAFAYFILVMFFFLAISVEIHIRRISETLNSSRDSD